MRGLVFYSEKFENEKKSKIATWLSVSINMQYDFLQLFDKNQG